MELRALKKILIIDDAPVYRESLRIILKEMYEVLICSTFEKDENALSLCDADLVIVGTDRLSENKNSFLENASSILKNKPVIFMIEDDERHGLCSELYNKTAFVSRDSLSLLGILDTARKILKPPVPEKKIFSSVLPEAETESEIISLLDKNIGKSLSAIAGTTIPVFINGEPGTPREAVARLIHERSPLRGHSFLRISADNIALRSIGESVLALLKKDGSVAGTVFFDDIEKVPISVQKDIVCLVDGVAGGEILSAGVSSLRVMVIADSSKNPALLMREGILSDDLYYRITAFPIFIPPLRERVAEISKLVEKLALQIAARYSLPLKKFSRDSIELIKSYIWPGNIDELKSVIMRSMVFCTGTVVKAHDLKFFFGMPFSGEMQNSENESFLYYDEGEAQGVKARSDIMPENSSISSSDIVVSLAHEIKNPLVGIKTFASLLPYKYEDADFRKDFYEIVNQDVDRIDGLVERIMEFGNVDQGMEENCDVNEIIKEVAEENSAIIASREINLCFELSEIPVFIKGLRNAYKYALSNLLITVAEGSKKGGTIKVLSGINLANGGKGKVKIMLLGEKDELMKTDIVGGIETLSVILAKMAVEKNDGSIKRTDEQSGGFSGFVFQLTPSSS